MNLDIILGRNIDTMDWIGILKNKQANKIIVIDYDYDGDSYQENGITFASTLYMHSVIENYQTKNFYKSLYGLPGMEGRMALLYKSEKNDDK